MMKVWDELYLYGTAGYDKSHLLAALACYPIRQEKIVIYLPDCRALLRDYVVYIKQALLLTFDGSVKRQEQAEAVENEKAIKVFLE